MFKENGNYKSRYTYNPKETVYIVLADIMRKGYLENPTFTLPIEEK